MTYDECVKALNAHPREAVVLALIAQVHEFALTECSDDALTAVAWALDSARRWAFGEPNHDECEAATYAVAANAAYAATYAVAAVAANAATYAATYANAVAANAAYAATYAATYTARRQQLVERLGKPGQWGPVHRLTRDSFGVLVAGDYVWCGNGVLDGRFGEATTAEHAVLLDELRSTL